jgi:ankyrin repeat protein
MRIAAGFSRKVGMLHKMVDAAANGDLKYSKVIAYIESQCVEEEVVSDDDGEDDDMTNYGDDSSSAWPTPKNSNRRFDGGSRNPGAASAAAPGKAKKPKMKTVPNEELRKELWYDSQGHSLLRKAVLKSAPHRLLAKLCELCPEAAHVEDSKGRLVLHHACRLPVNEQTEAILLLLLQTHVLGVIHRDSGGRTPLHYLFWYHAAQRSVEIVTAFCGRIRKTKFYALRQPQESGSKVGSTSLPPLPEIPTPNASHSVPNTAAIIPDSQHGCLPIHYAVMEGASVDALTVLLQAYPLSKHVVDRYGQTPLHWYLGGHYFCQSTHVSGCERDPNARPWYSSPIDANVVRLLSSSRVARTGDNQGRTPLHWAACYWAHAYHYQALSDEEDPTDFPLTVSTTKLIVDHHIGALGQKDHRQQTPLMVLFQTTFTLQSGYKGPLLPPRFAPTLPCVQLLLEGTLAADKPVADENRQSQPKNKAVELSRGKRRGCVTTLEDASGDLPLHAAVSTAAPLEIVEAILSGHDGALLHSNDSSRVPLHCAFGAAHSAQLQHNDVVSLLLSKTPGLLDGRLALKMEDSTGQYPIHLACQNNASIDILQLLVKAYPKTALLQNQNGCLPVHTVVSSHVLVSALSLGKAASERVRGEDEDAPDDACVNEMRQERQRLFVAQARQKKLHDIQETREKILTLIEPILLSEKANTHLTLADEGGYLPLHFVVLFGAEYETLYRVLRACPVAALQLTNDGKSVLDLHEQRLFQKDWKEVRQLLFSYAPTLESHRHRVELLKQCVEIIVQEVGATSNHGADQSSFHWNAEQRLKETEKSLEENPELQLTQTLSTNIDVVKSSLSLSQQSMTYHHMVKAVSQVSRVKSINAAAAELSVKGKFTPRRRKGNQPSRGPKSFELSASLSDNAPVSSSPRAQAQSKYDEGDTKLNYILSDTEYDDDDSYFSDDDDEEEEYLSDEDHTESECDTTNRDSVTNGAPTHTFSSDFEASKSHDFHPMSSHSTLEEIFMSAKLKAMKSDNEEKKEEFETRSREGNASLGIDTTTSSRSLMAPACDSDDSMLAFAVRPEWFSEVGLRLWSFFALYRDKNNPNDNYSSQVTSIFNEIEYDCVETLVMLPLPSCARVYFPDTPTKDLKRLIFREAANPKCREFMHRMCFFIGTYEFQSDDGSDIAVYQSEDGSSVVIKAHEWLFTTEESTDAVIPGVSEATIWKTGEVPAEVGLAFRSVRRSVRMHFTTRKDVYDSEVQSRVQAGVPVESRGFEAVKSMLPLLNHYNANDSSRRENRIYLSDVQDGRFSTLQLCRGNCVGVRDTISLADYPFALVYPDTSAESLDSLYSNLGIAGSPRLQTLCKEMGNALSELHQSGECSIFVIFNAFKG